MGGFVRVAFQKKKRNRPKICNLGMWMQFSNDYKYFLGYLYHGRR